MLADADDPACTDPTQDGELPRNDLRVDVRPDSLNPDSLGMVPVTLFASPRYDLCRADPDTLAFGPASAPRAHDHGPHAAAPDADGPDGFDGPEDWMLHFRMQASGLAVGDTQACLRVEIARVPFEACDTVMIPPGAAAEPPQAEVSGEGSQNSVSQAENASGPAVRGADRERSDSASRKRL